MSAMSSDRELAHRHDADHDPRKRPADREAADAPPPDLAGVVQAKADGGRVALTGDQDVRAAAATGVQSGGSQLPHLDKIQASFGGAHDLSGVRAHVGGEAAAASAQMGAQGYATGSDVAFAQQPDLFLAAHEAAHVVQQREGVQMKGGVGQAGDVYEQHADKVAERVVAGQSAADLLPASAGGSGGAVQMYNEKVISGEAWRVSESGKSMLKEEDKLQDLFATNDLIATANAALKTAGDKGSFISLKAGAASLKVGENTLHRVEPVMNPTGTDAANDILREANKDGAEDSAGETDDSMALWADCGRSSRTIMGTDGQGQAPHAKYKDGGGTATTGRSYNPATYSDEIYLKEVPKFLKSAEAAAYLKDGVHYDAGDKTALKTPTTADEARAMYWELGEDGRRAFDKFAGINTAADPAIGGAYTMNTEYKMPGSGVVPGKKRWNFHWGGVILKDGSNNVTLENYAVGFAATGDAAKDAENRKRAYDWVNHDWNFQMYGTAKKGQSFHEEHLDTGTHGTRASTFAAQVD
ncbi:MAG: DUF4157 domain-containing protein [Myxococcales bacterium]|nr:DUF4157 domain-containing protein [Myxococcales bacterium]MBP6845326.1 DUF4157 domain-containing protein [Kofleriaceae bacterium]